MNPARLSHRRVRQLLAKAEGTRPNGLILTFSRKKLDAALREKVADTKLGQQIVRINAAMDDDDSELSETLLEEMEEGEAKDYFSNCLLSMKIQRLEMEKRKIEVEQMRLKGEYGICRMCGEEKEYVYAPSSLCDEDEREICSDCLAQKELKEKLEENRRRIESRELFRKPKGWGANDVDKLTEVLNEVFKKVPISIEMFTQIQDLLNSLAERIDDLVSSRGDDL